MISGYASVSSTRHSILKPVAVECAQSLLRTIGTGLWVYQSRHTFLLDIRHFCKDSHWFPAGHGRQFSGCRSNSSVLETNRGQVPGRQMPSHANASGLTASWQIDMVMTAEHSKIDRTELARTVNGWELEGQYLPHVILPRLCSLLYCDRVHFQQGFSNQGRE